jgi:biotin synthase-like enzyme
MVVQQARRIVRRGSPRVRVYQSAYFPPSEDLQQAADAVEIVGTQGRRHARGVPDRDA